MYYLLGPRGPRTAPPETLTTASTPTPSSGWFTDGRFQVQKQQVSYAGAFASGRSAPSAASEETFWPTPLSEASDGRSSSGSRVAM